MANKTQKQIEIGQEVVAIFAWREDEKPTDANFFTGKVSQIIERAKNCFYVRIEGLSQIIPIERVQSV